MSDTSNKNKYCLTFADVQAAAQRIQGTAHRTPVLTSTSLNQLASSGGGGGGSGGGGNNAKQTKRVFFKVEALQKTGSFKFRGALNAIRSVLETQESSSSTTATDTTSSSSSSLQVVTHSSGNHAQALALAARLASTTTTAVTATIVMPENTPLVKKQAVSDFGATIVMVASTNEARETEAERIRDETGATFIHPSEDPRVIAGQGTVCLELVQQVQEMTMTAKAAAAAAGTGGPNGSDGIDHLDAVIIPVGGGGLAAGNLISLRALYGDKVKIILAEPSVLDDAKRSFDTGTLVGHAADNTLDSVADGLKTTLGPHTWPIVRDLADAILTVSEVEILKATKLIWERLKVAIEPSAGVGVAVLLSEAFQTRFGNCHNIGVILCGGNVDVLKIATKMQSLGL